MGLSFVEGQAPRPNWPEEAVKFLVDSGAGHTLLPYRERLLLGQAPTHRGKFTLADGTIVARNWPWCYLNLPQGQGYSPVVPGEETDDQASPGAVALAEMGLALNPVGRTLHPMRLLWRG